MQVNSETNSNLNQHDGNPATLSGGTSKAKVLLVGSIVAALIIIAGVVAFMASHSNSKTANTTTTKDGKTYVSNANDTGAAVRGVEILESLKAGYRQTSLQSSQLGTIKTQLSGAGVSDMLTANGSTAYGTTQQDGGNAVGIFWGTTSAAYNKATFNAKLNAYSANLYKQYNATVNTSSAQPIMVHTTSNKSYQLPCVDTVATTNDGSAPTYSAICQGTLGASHAYISYSTAASDQTTVNSVLATFTNGSKIEY